MTTWPPPTPQPPLDPPREEWICTTVLEYTDRAEGQVLHRGSKEDCDACRDMLSAICIGPDVQVPIATSLLICKASEFNDLQPGQHWRARRPTT